MAYHQAFHIIPSEPPLNLSETPILADEYPVKLPRNPAQAIFAKGTYPSSVG